MNRKELHALADSVSVRDHQLGHFLHELIDSLTTLLPAQSDQKQLAGQADTATPAKGEEH